MDVAAAEGYTALALAVIKRAIADTDPRVPREIRDKALHFLAGGPALSWWCALAGVPPETISRRCVGFKKAAYLSA